MIASIKPKKPPAITLENPFFGGGVLYIKAKIIDAVAKRIFEIAFTPMPRTASDMFNRAHSAATASADFKMIDWATSKPLDRPSS